MIINTGRGIWGNYGTQAVGPVLEYILASFSVRSRTTKAVFLEDFNQLIFALRVHAIASAIEVLHKPKSRYSPDQSFEELFTMWSDSFWGTVGPCLEDEEYYKELEICVKEEVNFEIGEIVHSFFALKTNQLRKIPVNFHYKFLEFIYIVRTDAVNKMIQAIEKKSATKTLDGFLQELITIGNPSTPKGKPTINENGITREIPISDPRHINSHAATKLSI